MAIVSNGVAVAKNAKRTKSSLLFGHQNGQKRLVCLESNLGKIFDFKKFIFEEKDKVFNFKKCSSPAKCVYKYAIGGLHLNFIG